MRRFGLVLAMSAIGAVGCTPLSIARPPTSEFALIGDMPYDGRQEREFDNLLGEINRADLAFVIHDGDFWWDGIAWKDSTPGLSPCADETFADRLQLTKRSRHPFVLVPGDNDWADCHRAKPFGFDPMERLDKLRQVFFAGDRSLGQNPIALTRQSLNPQYSQFRENVSWVYQNVMFVTLHMIGSNNNLGRTPEMDEEFSRRNAANRAWLKQAFAQATKNGNRAIMIVAQANPRFENRWPAKHRGQYMLDGLKTNGPATHRSTGFDDFLETLEAETLEFRKPVVYVHGDTHLFRIDQPLLGSTSQRVIENFTRVETIGYPDTHWIRVSIDPDDPNVFRFRQEIVPANRVRH